MSDLERISVTIDRALLSQLDELVSRSGASRSEIVRDLVRERLTADLGPDEPVVGTVTLVYDQHARALSDRLVALAHDHHDLVLSTLHVHLDHDRCLEVSALRGPRSALQAYADALVGTKGVLQGQLVIAGAAG